MNELQVRLCPVDQLVPYPKNARAHSPEQINQIAASIQEFGWTNPILVGADNVTIAGHARLAAAKKLGLAEVPIIVLAHLTEAQRRALVIADNQLALNAGWDEELLRVELAALREEEFDINLIGFDDAELSRLLAGEPGVLDEDAVLEPQPVVVSREGDFWHLGKHRVLCGNATSADTVARLLDGRQPFLMCTDPPYGIELDSEWRDRADSTAMEPPSPVT